MKDAVDVLSEKIKELEAIAEEQRLRLKSLLEPAEEATGKQGSTAILTYIARLEAENKRLRAAFAGDVGSLADCNVERERFRTALEDIEKELRHRKGRLHNIAKAALEGSSVGDSDETNFDAVDSQNRYYHHNIHLDAEEYECAMMVLDDMEIPRADKDDKVYSLVGRIRCLADEA